MVEQIDQLINFLYNLPGGHLSLALVLLAIFAFVFYSLYRVVFYLLKKAADRTSNTLDDDIINCMQDPAVVFILLSAVYLAFSTAYPDYLVAGFTLHKIFFVLMLLVAGFAIDRLLTTFLEWYKHVIAPKTESKLDDELIPIIEKLVRLVVYIVAIIMALDNLGVQITPLLAGLGIASLAVALALQDSLGNFFAGVNISVDKPFRKNDYISMDTGIEGVVQEIGWRSTKIITLQNNSVIIPNTKIAQSVVTNYYSPDQTTRQSASVGVSYNEDVNRVANVIRGAIKSAAQSSKILDNGAEPVVRFTSFGDFFLEFTYLYWVKNYRFRDDALDEVNRSIFYAFKKEGIEIPFPTRTVYSYPATGAPQPKPQSIPQPPAANEFGKKEKSAQKKRK